jgi:hypothetical protein
MASSAWSLNHRNGVIVGMSAPLNGADFRAFAGKSELPRDSRHQAG